MKNTMIKTILVMICATTMLFSARAQNGYANLPAYNRCMDLPETKVKAYRSLNDVLKHNPTQELNVHIGIRPQEYGVVYHKLLAPKQERKKIGRIYGFSIDSNLYINPRAPRTGRLSDFYQAEIIGPYLHFPKVEKMYIANKYGPPTVITWLSDKFVDTKTGKLKTLNRMTFRKLAANRPELLAAFNKERHKRDKLLSYFKEYCKANS